MRRICLLLSVLALTGCPNGNPDGIRAEIDGKRIEFREHPSAIVTGLGGRRETMTFGATVKGSEGTESFEIDLELPGGQLAKTSYSARQAIESQPRPGFRLNDSLTAQYSPDTSGSYINDSDRNGSAGDFVVQLTKLSDDRIEGTFAGGLEHDGRVVQVSDGHFSMTYEYKPRNTPW